MNYQLSEWLNLIFRWIHVVVGILWIGQTAFFSWLDARFTVESDGDDNAKSTIWMVHSGGFYVVEKQKVPELLPRTLHWFKWEAALSWLSGILLLILVYYLGGLAIEPDAELELSTVIAIGIATLVLGWAVYDLLWITIFEKHEAVGTWVSLALLAAAAYALSETMSGRSAYIHVGALFGTIMAANVWMRILPAQRNMIDATRAGQKADMTLAARAKERSKHNTFMAIPLIFIMISNHFPTASYGHRHHFLMLLAFIVAGFGARYLMNVWNNRPS